MRVVFMGTPQIAAGCLSRLIADGFDLVGVYTKPDMPKNRGMKLAMSEVKEVALAAGLPVYQPATFRDDAAVEELRALRPDVIAVVAYGKILPQELLDIPKYGCINVHGSLLPKYRGAAPIQWAVLNGDKETGITTMFMNAGMDTGDMILKEKVQIGEDETTGELWNRLKNIGAKLLIETIKKIEAVSEKEKLSVEELKNKVGAQKQGEEFSMAPMLSKEMAKIDWENKTANEIKNLVRGLNPIMGAHTFLEGKKIKFWKVQVLTEEELLEKFEELKEYQERLKKLEPGTVLFSDDKKGLFIKAKEQILEVLEIQGENSKKMPIQDFLRGNKINIGSIFE